ncbi:glucose-6-phosphate 1-dehydrogenase [Endobacter medicaginis]|jgi:glucose-6-phosphate 1-dehydrogenase|uniref:Glucose-6-phosphate 1-dehydrogenase n=1 Tax=Endobacter medicaginis TaxID=1181271 RepID=A0A850NPU2_9PROT|nr:glucose-6-phosphate dehydrogenase [Endobacter medicaginis]MBB3173591.1 glucose-6-phosphate 1-dehydrogenase [Endobacter medicaginis]MCX5475775.1 glucose-6-phosphate dehydrogenase [Endobacter medicaginis]NVN28998.1 glucose-6-phosphate dehydrogenase [Endobacter medicaginis]
MEALDLPLDGVLEAADGPQPLRAPPCTLVIFGGSGDLTARLLVPALYNLAVAQLLDPGFRVIAVDWQDQNDEKLREKLTVSIQDFAAKRQAHATLLDVPVWTWLRDHISYLRGDFQNPDTYAALAAEIGTGNCVFYLAVAARFFGTIVEGLGASGLTREDGCFRRVIIEKPFGADLGSARLLNRDLAKSLSESQIYRIDHYLGKETVQNILALRFSNGIFEPLWNRQNIDHVQITAAETVGVEARGRFYEGTGALRDMVPNHIMQLLAMTAMEAPSSFDADAVRDEKSKVLQAIHHMPQGNLPLTYVRGQYTAGTIGDRAVPGYLEEPDIDPHSDTETYVAMKVAVDNWRWAGVPFYLRTGKRLSARKTEVAIHFKQAPYALFRDTPVEKLTPNIMVLHIQPSEGCTIQFSAKRPGPIVKLGGVRMKFDYADWFPVAPSTGYETLIYDCMIGDATLFQRADNVEAGWAAVEPALEARAEGLAPIRPYVAGTRGPAEADTLLEGKGRSWLRLRT